MRQREHVHETCRAVGSTKAQTTSRPPRSSSNSLPTTTYLELRVERNSSHGRPPDHVRPLRRKRELAAAGLSLDGRHDCLCLPRLTCTGGSQVGVGNAHRKGRSVRSYRSQPLPLNSTDRSHHHACPPVLDPYMVFPLTPTSAVVMTCLGTFHPYFTGRGRIRRRANPYESPRTDLDRSILTVKSTSCMNVSSQERLLVALRYRSVRSTFGA